MKNDPAFTYEETVQVGLISFQKFRHCTGHVVFSFPCLEVIFSHLTIMDWLRGQ